MGLLPQNNDFEYVPFPNVVIADRFWSKRTNEAYRNTLPAILDQLKITGRWDAFRLIWRPGDVNPPHIFWDSDTAKFLEAACYALVAHDDPQLLTEVEQQIEWICDSQWDDGYINSFYTLVEPQNRFSNIRDCHELYCAGHLLEAAIAYYQLSGNSRFLNAMTRYVTLIQSTFGPGEDQLQGYPGHEELELALMKLYRLTNASEHRDLARFFIEERGQKRNGKHYYELEAERNGASLWPGHFKQPSWFEYMQAGKPIREQSTIEGTTRQAKVDVGHAVRAMYFLCGVSDVALCFKDTSLLTALAGLYHDMVDKKMYITYGIGSVHQWEGFGEPYDLPNSSAYCETCASIGLVFLTHRLLQWDWNTLAQHNLNPRDIADVLEGALYNAVGAGVSIDGKAFFYVNPLETNGRNTKRRDWFDTSCCPPNVARLFCSLGEYPFLIKKLNPRKIALAIVLYINSSFEMEVDGETIKVNVTTDWPSSGRVQVSFENAENIEIALRLRVPGWAENYVHEAPIERDGFLHYPPRRYATETVSLDIPFTVRVTQSHPQVQQNTGCIAIRRGPFIYAMETIDNDFVLSDARVILGTYLDEPIMIKGMECRRLHVPGKVREKERILKFVPYWSWGNRGDSDVLVWCKTD